MLLCSHLLADVQAICDRVAIVSEGKLVKFGTVPELVGPSQSFKVYVSGLDGRRSERSNGARHRFHAETTGN